MSYTFAIGDIHGCLGQLLTMVGKIETARPDGGTIVFLGDYVDRGPASSGVIDFLMDGPSSPKWTWITLKGNHEAMMQDALNGGNMDHWLSNGGAETLASYDVDVPRSHGEWISRLPLFHVDDHRIFVHAGIEELVPISMQSESVLLWKRVPSDYSGVYGGKHLVHGHTPSTNNPRTIGNRTNVDSGAVYGGKLSCAVFDDSLAGHPIEFIEV